MVDLLFRGRTPAADNTVLDAGCGTGQFIDGIIRWCQRRRLPVPRITGIESDPRHLLALRAKYGHLRFVSIEHADFLNEGSKPHDYIVGNPPYVPITGLSEGEKARYRTRYTTAKGRFDLYLLFFEEALRRLAPGGRLVFITPEKYLYVETAGSLRDLLARHNVEEILLVSEDTFGDLVTYPTITVISHLPPGKTRVVRRDGTAVAVTLPTGRDSWLPVIEEVATENATVRLADVCLRVSCGVATGADRVFVRPAAGLDPSLRPFAHLTIAGRELVPGLTDLPSRFVMLVPYEPDGRLMPLSQLGAFRSYLLSADVRRQLLARTCVKRKPWYAFHETPVLRDILRPKILCKDIGEIPHFWIDRPGDVIPRHSLYYIVPRDPAKIDLIAEYLRSPSAHEWLRRNCQRAAKGYLRLQSHVLQRLPVPDNLGRVAAGGRHLIGIADRPLQAQLPLG
ncbi:MAG: Eco57I restriction-modification methylase domain-containing protein [Deltaproteobacteria bacterium]|nr:Eco57I restriction-modification methylase domain-containing protein [Deltaproteobacteria bacterium]MBI2365832.1 Eco57I restriction-modification methylase domain-containing protein [Deltaproteobacteria bacterium]